MKNILMPTDFSVPAENAAQYALQLAKALKADVLLCNAYKVPAKAPMAAQVAWPLMDATEIEQEVTNELDKLVKDLSDPSCATAEPAFCPVVTYESREGTVTEVVKALAKKRKTDLVVMGMAGAGGLTQFVLGSNSREMIENAAFPLLLVPYEASFKPIRKIAFATDLSDNDLRPLQVLIDFAAALNSEITIVHITNKELHPKDKLQLKIDNFLKAVAENNTNFSKVKYEYVWNIDIDNGLDWIAGQKDLDLMAMCHHKHHMIEKIFKGSHTQKLSRHIKIPLLVFPSI